MKIIITIIVCQILLSAVLASSESEEEEEEVTVDADKSLQTKPPKGDGDVIPESPTEVVLLEESTVPSNTDWLTTRLVPIMTHPTTEAQRETTSHHMTTQPSTVVVTEGSSEATERISTVTLYQSSSQTVTSPSRTFSSASIPTTKVELFSSTLAPLTTVLYESTAPSLSPTAQPVTMEYLETEELHSFTIIEQFEDVSTALPLTTTTAVTEITTTTPEEISTTEAAVTTSSTTELIVLLSNATATTPRGEYGYFTRQRFDDGEHEVMTHLSGHTTEVSLPEEVSHGTSSVGSLTSESTEQRESESVSSPRASLSQQLSSEVVTSAVRTEETTVALTSKMSETSATSMTSFLTTSSSLSISSVSSMAQTTALFIAAKPDSLTVELLALNASQMEVVWSRALEDHIEYYSVKTCLKDVQVPENQTTLRIQNLIAGQDCFAAVAACTRHSCGEHTRVHNTTYPAQPHNFTVTAQTTQSVNFFWNLEGYADEFLLYVNDAETDVHTGHCAKDDSIVIGRVACNLGGLPTPGMEYNVSVRLCRAQLCVASEYLPVRTVPARPVTLRLINTTTTDAVFLIWEQNGVADNFTITVNDSGARKSWQWLEGREKRSVLLRVRGLSKPGQHYNVSVTSFSGHLHSDAVSSVFTTKPAQPGPLQLMNRTTNSLSIHWPQTGFIDNIQVVVNRIAVPNPMLSFRRENSLTWVRTSLSDLPVAGAVYNVSVISMYAGDASSEQFGFFRTVPATPEIHCISTSNTTLTLCISTPPSVQVSSYSGAYSPVNIMSGITPFSPHMDICGSGNRGAILTKLTPGTTYEFDVVAWSEDVQSEFAHSTFTTLVSPPVNVIVQDINETVIKVFWGTPQGQYYGFQVHCVGGLQNATRRITQNSPFPDDHEMDGIHRDTVPLSAFCTDLTPGALYRVTVTTILQEDFSDIGAASKHNHITIPNSPEMVVVLTKPDSVLLSLSYPVKAQCTSYIVTAHLSPIRRTAASAAAGSGLSDPAARPNTVNCSLSSYTLIGLSDNSRYQVSVNTQSAYHDYASKISASTSGIVWTLASAVSTLLVTSDGPDSMTLKWVQPDRYEYIVAYWISVVSSTEPCCPLYLKLKCTNRMAVECQGCVTASVVREVDCSVANMSYVVTSLVTARNYSVSLSPQNSGGNSTAVRLFYTIAERIPSGSSAGEVAGVVIACIIGVVLGAGAVFLYMRMKRPKLTLPSSKRPSSADMFGFPNPTFAVDVDDCLNRPNPVALNTFIEHITDLHRDSDYNFSAEYALLGQLSTKHEQTSAELPVNRVKNRYSNVLPFEHSRVKLVPIDDDEEGSDYINASYVPGFTSKREFIATQGPLKSTVTDFWQMIWEQNVCIIVMVTNLDERGREKCSQYWPSDSDPTCYGNVQLQIKSVAVMDDYLLRVMNISVGDRKRVIKQFHFSTWPDFGCPESTIVLLEFVQRVRAHVSGGKIAPGPAGPLLVHCSAGVGRTGTFILIDRLLQHISVHNSVDIFGLVLEMRGYRSNMIQTEAQYIFAHECIRTALEHKMHLANGLFTDFNNDENERSNPAYSDDECETD